VLGQRFDVFVQRFDGFGQRFEVLPPPKNRHRCQRS
jgi:hypothetical protein